MEANSAYDIMNNINNSINLAEIDKSNWSVVKLIMKNVFV